MQNHTKDGSLQCVQDCDQVGHSNVGPPMIDHVIDHMMAVGENSIKKDKRFEHSTD